MQRKHITKYAVALSMAAMVMVPNAFALNWMDGAPAKYHFTYNGDNGGIASVSTSDRNNTFNGKVEKGQTITTQTGTIVWRDSYTNTTTFTVDVEPGYYLAALTGNVGDAQFTKQDADTYTFQFTDKGAEAWCFGDDVSFDLVTEKIPYTVNFYADGQLINHTKATVNDPLDLSVVPSKEGYSFVGWTLDGQLVGNALTPEMLQSATEDHVISLEAQFAVNSYPVTIRYHLNSNDEALGGSTSTRDNVQIAYGTQIDETWLADNYYLGAYTMLGGDHTVTVGTDGAVIDLVKKADDIDLKNNAYFTLFSKDAGVLQVTCSINGGDAYAFDVNETAVLPVGSLTNQSVITFHVVVEDGKELALECSDGSKKVQKNEDGTYTFQFTRHHLDISDPSNDVTFSLSTH